jgi:hypothetical protein
VIKENFNTHIEEDESDVHENKVNHKPPLNYVNGESYNYVDRQICTNSDIYIDRKLSIKSDNYIERQLSIKSDNYIDRTLSNESYNHIERRLSTRSNKMNGHTDQSSKKDGGSVNSENS